MNAKQNLKHEAVDEMKLESPIKSEDNSLLKDNQTALNSPPNTISTLKKEDVNIAGDSEAQQQFVSSPIEQLSKQAISIDSVKVESKQPITISEESHECNTQADSQRHQSGFIQQLLSRPSQYRYLSVIVILSGMFIFYEYNMHNSNGTNPMHSNQTNKTNYVGTSLSDKQITADNLMETFIKDQRGASGRYYGKPMVVSGNVISKGSFTNSTDYAITIYLKKTNGYVYRVIGELPSNRNDLDNKIHKGDFVKLEGSIIGVVPQQDSHTLDVHFTVTGIK